ncbi:uncharacterized protein LOC142333712 [Lycorma delicatula]|uniref:uncharacterized protein LOC142333712 n=1 Tax=Lycorma delicatula TaxID=130591 RepID=UPI003F5119FE
MRAITLLIKVITIFVYFNVANGACFSEDWNTDDNIKTLEDFKQKIQNSFRSGKLHPAQFSCLQCINRRITTQLKNLMFLKLLEKAKLCNVTANDIKHNTFMTKDYEKEFLQNIKSCEQGYPIKDINYYSFTFYDRPHSKNAKAPKNPQNCMKQFVEEFNYGTVKSDFIKIQKHYRNDLENHDLFTLTSEISDGNKSCMKCIADFLTSELQKIDVLLLKIMLLEYYDNKGIRELESILQVKINYHRYSEAAQSWVISCGIYGPVKKEEINQSKIESYKNKVLIENGNSKWLEICMEAYVKSGVNLIRPQFIYSGKETDRKGKLETKPTQLLKRKNYFSDFDVV